MFFVTIIQFYPVFYFPYSSRKKSCFEVGETKWFGVEGFSIIIFCVIMIIFSSLSYFFGKSFMFARKRAPWRLNLYFCISEYDRKMYLSAWAFMYMCRWMKMGVKVEMRRKEENPIKRNFLFAFAFFFCVWGLCGSKNMKIESWFNFTQQLFLLCYVFISRNCYSYYFVALFVSLLVFLWIYGRNKYFAGAES